MLARLPSKFACLPARVVSDAAWPAAKRRAKQFFLKDEFGVGYWDLARLQVLPRGQRASLQVLGRAVQLTDGYWGSHCYREIFCDQIYRFRARTSAPFILDCGANVGLSVIYFKWLYPDARVIAFEPDPQVYGLLLANLRNFDYSDIELHQQAVWTSEGPIAFRPDGSVGGRVLDGATTDVDLAVPAARLRDCLVRPIDLLKLDVEGVEFQVLADCQDRLHNVEYLFVEYHGQATQPQTLHDLLGILQRGGFRYHLQDAHPIRHPFLKDARRKGFDLQMNVFAFRD